MISTSYRIVKRNSEAAAVEKETRAYSFRIRLAQTLPDPMIEFGLENMGLDGWMLGKDPNRSTY